VHALSPVYLTSEEDRVKKSRLTVLAPALALAFLVSLALPPVAQSTPATKDKVVLRLWGGSGIPRKDDPTPFGRSTRAVFEAFKKEHPEIELVSVSGLTIQGPASESNFLLSMAGGTAPDVFYVNFRKLHTFLGQGFMAPLDPFLKNDPEVLARVHPQIRKVITVKGHVYCIPWFQCVMALHYRKDLFRDAGLNPDRPPRNWDEFYRYAQKLTDQDNGQWGFCFPMTAGSWYLTDFIWQAGGDVIAHDKNGNYHAVFNRHGGPEALSFFAKLTRGEWTRNGKKYLGVASYDNNQTQNIKLGKIAMWFTYTQDSVATASELNPSLLGIAPLPAGPTGIKANEINAGMWAMSSQIKDPRVRKAAWEYIKFMTGPKADEIRTRSYVESGMWKYVNPDKLIKYGFKEYTREIPKSWMAANVDAFKHGRPEPNGPNCEMIYIEMDTPMQAIFQNPNADPQRLMDICCARVNRKMIGIISPAELRWKRPLAWVIVVAMLLAVSFVVTRQVRQVALSQVSETADSRVAARRGINTQLIAWLFMLPAVGSVAIWAYYPLLRGMVMAFQNYKILGGGHFVGLDNFIQVLSQDTFRIGMIHSFQYVLFSLGLGFFVPIFLALMLAEVPRGKMLFRTLFYLPAITSGVVIMFLWKIFYDPTPQGLFNSILAFFHVPPQLWLGNSLTAMVCVILPVIWAAAGPGSIIYLAALKSIPDEMYEAADVDGAGIWVKIRHVVFPMLKPLIIINFVGAFIGAFKAMENVFIMTGGGPNYATHVIGLDIWYNAFMYLKFGFATSEAWIMGSMLIGFTMYQLRILKDIKFSAAAEK
jgi:ABC-type sugar transport system permease subunit/ABC-type glycerol-3-phosphate transport system substrate-binding protein